MKEQGTWDKEKRKRLQTGTRRLLEVMDIFHRLDFVMVFTGVYMYQNHQIAYFKEVPPIVYNSVKL